ncbi:MAG: M23 family metallopeptidase [candidate division WOR-3 bacterium]
MKKWTLLFITYKGKIWSITFSEKVVFYTIIVLSTLLGAFTYITIEGTKKKALLLEYKKLEYKRNEYLTKFLGIKQKVESLQENLAEIGRNNEILSLIGKLRAVNKAIKEMGTGGFQKTKEFYSLELDSGVKEVERQIEKVANLIELERQTLKNADNKLKELQDKLSHYPSLWPTTGRITSGFGWRPHPITGGKEFHKGYDISNRANTPVVATADGVVTFAGRWGGYGNVVVIDHGYGFSTRYAHLNRAYVKEGQEVKRGHVIGTMGCTGFTTGTHLHYEVRVLGNVVNPMGYLDTFPYTY